MTETAELKTKNIRVLVLFGAIPLYGQERGNLRVFQDFANWA